LKWQFYLVICEKGREYFVGDGNPDFPDRGNVPGISSYLCAREAEAPREGIPIYLRDEVDLPIAE
jgi:hypothetical protein